MINLRVCFYLLLIVAVFGLSVYQSHEAQAAVGVKFTSCAVGGLLAPEITRQMNTNLDKLLVRIPVIGKYFGGLVGVSEVPVGDKNFLSAWTNKELRGDMLARCTAREIFNAMSKGIVTNARTAGRNGGPAWIRNWQNFLTEAQYRGEGEFRAILSTTQLCNYFNDNIKKMFGATAKISLIKNTRTGNLDPYALRANCTMPSNFNLTNYQNDFAGNGGWNAFSRMLEPQNNYYGTLFGALDETARQRAMEESVDLNQALANKGFIGRSGTGVSDNCQTKDANGRCLAYKDINTPGTVMADSVAATIQQELAWVTNIHDVGEVISAATEILLNRLIDLSNQNEGDYTIYEGPTISDPPEGGGEVPCDNPPSTLSPNPFSVMQQVISEFPDIDLSDEGPGPGTRDEFTAIVAWRLHQKDTNWGRKRAAGPQSTDTLGYLRPDIGPGRFEAVDLLQGGSGTFRRGCTGVVDAGQTWIQPIPAPTTEPGETPMLTPGPNETAIPEIPQQL